MVEICPKPGSKTLPELAVEQSNTLHLPPTLPDITGTVWAINLADRRDEHTERGYGGVGSGLIMPLAVPLANGIRRDRVIPRATVGQMYGHCEKGNSFFNEG